MKSPNSLWKKLEARNSSSAKVGFVQNEFGTFDDAAISDELISYYRGAVESAVDQRDEVAYVFSLSCLLKRLRRYEEADELLSRKMDGSGFGNEIGLQNIRAKILANLGKEEAARNLAVIVNSRTNSPMWRLSDDTIREELARASPPSSG